MPESPTSTPSDLTRRQVLAATGTLTGVSLPFRR